MRQNAIYKILGVIFFLAMSLSCQREEQKSRYSSENIQQGYFLQDGKTSGDFQSYYENGQIETKGCFRKGKMNGTWYYYYPNGKLKLIQKFRRGKTVAIDAWDMYGKQVVFCGTGTLESYYPNMTKKSVISYKDCHIDGVSEGWYPNGTKEYECYYDRGKPIKTWRMWDEDGNLAFEETY